MRASKATLLAGQTLVVLDVIPGHRVATQQPVMLGHHLEFRQPTPGQTRSLSLRIALTAVVSLRMYRASPTLLVIPALIGWAMIAPEQPHIQTTPTPPKILPRLLRIAL
jgi:hypothetical protein